MRESSRPAAPEEVARAYRRIPEWTRDELAGLSAAQLDRTGAEEWARWSPRRQLSHMAYVTTRWFMVLYGAAGLPWRPVDMSQFASFINSREDDRRFSAARYSDVEWLHLRFAEACGAAAARIENREAESAEASLLFVFTDASVVGATEERAVDLWNRCVRRHPDGFEADPDHAHAFRLTPLAALRHALWDDLIHLRSIRLHREAMGLPPVHPDAPPGGYASAYPVS